MKEEVLNDSTVAQDFADYFQKQTDMEFKPVVQIDYSSSPAVKDIKKILKHSEAIVNKFSTQVQKDSQTIQSISDTLEKTDADEAKKYGG
ncbi:DUF3130 family protein [Listeria fleischmannii]|uniref:Uncharacterized protein n=1 Tax=Listeria fleischmannii FSL S10-1203 TaxID=1265822 RepID=W7DX89_9LIST|nr:DUF3130 family protein [Listeria fleischmannii]EUJ64871.1 hypothetical protein MCOL2_01730 [Listeria fleischmannii FSL S10-1203]